MSMNRYLDSTLKLILVLVLACVLARFRFTVHPFVHLVSILTVGLTIAIRFFVCVPFHKLSVN
jgi:hypothetical protein